MESSSETNQPSIQGYSTPPRSTIRSELPSISFHPAKLLTSSELKRRFSPIHSSKKKRRYNLIRKHDSIVPFEHNLNMPMILRTLFHRDQEETSTQSFNIEDSVVPRSSSSSSSSSMKSFQSITRPPCLFSSCLKTEQENTFSISETIMRDKLRILLSKK